MDTLGYSGMTTPRSKFSKPRNRISRWDFLANDVIDVLVICCAWLQDVQILAEFMERHEVQGTFCDLHALYKSKYETKVAALKKSYENRWEKKGRGLKRKVDQLENGKLRLGDARGVIVDFTIRGDLTVTYSLEKNGRECAWPQGCPAG
ncbi:hypothetical protein M434DRAFT_17897 [Hypoxylon sp. CO27-5]|nr:hypothetical protein M434DRAFT_17897 [Hypoxylon sp. CO27-5]